MKKNIMLFALLAGAALALYAQNAESIVRASRDRIKADTTFTRSRMVIMAKNGTTSGRVIEQYSKDGPNGSRTTIVFEEPATVAGTRFLTMEKPGGADDRWIYMSGKIRRIAAKGGSDKFVGTDFSFDDISSMSRNADLDTHTLLREENLAGDACYVIQSVPKDSSYQYSKMTQWITKNTQIVMKIELYDKKNTLVKTVEMSGLKDVQGRLTVHITKMTTHAAGTSTTINIERIEYDKPIPEGVFSTRYLETGRP